MTSAAISPAGAGTFDTKNVGDAKAVNAQPSAFTLTGNDSRNYTIGTVIPTSADITPVALTISAVTDSRPYDGTPTSAATPSVTGLQTGDSVDPLVQVFDSKNASAVDGRTLSISSAVVNDDNSGGNYTVDSSGTATGTIHRRLRSRSPPSPTAGPTTARRTSAATPSVTGLQTGDSVGSARPSPRRTSSALNGTHPTCCGHGP